MDIEWGKDGVDGLLYILQARPETVKSRPADGSQERFRLLESSELLVSGRAIGHKLGAGPVRIVKHAVDMGELKDGDILVTKRQWGAFHGTELDLQLRRRGIRTIVLGGVATHMGVESTARGAWEHGYNLVILKDATASLVGEAHEASMKYVFPRISRLADSGDLKFG